MYKFLSAHWKLPKDQQLVEFELLKQLSTLSHSEIARLDLYFWIVDHGLHKGNTATGAAAPLDAYDVMDLEHEMEVEVFRQDRDSDTFIDRTVSNFEEQMHALDIEKGKDPPYTIDRPHTGAPPLFESIFSLCPLGRPLLSYTYTMMRWLYYLMVIEGKYRSDGDLNTPVKEFVDAHNRWKQYEHVQGAMPYPDDMVSAQNQFAVKQKISNPEEIDRIMSAIKPSFLASPPSNAPISDEKQEPTEEKASEPTRKRSRSFSSSGDELLDRLGSRARTSRDSSESTHLSRSPEPMNIDQACELPGSHEQKIPDHISLHASAVRAFNYDDSEDEAILVEEPDLDGAPGDTKVVRYEGPSAKSTDPQNKKGYSNTAFFVFGAVLLGLAFMTDER